MKKILSLLSVVLFLSACSKTSDPAPVVEPSLKNIYLYSDADSNIVAYDPQALTSNPITTTGTAFQRTYKSFAIDATSSNNLNHKTNGIMYGENGMFYRASVDKYGTITKRQLTSTTNVMTICDTQTLSLNDYFFFKQPGVDNKCGTGDDLGPFGIHNTMDENSTLLTPPVYPLSYTIDSNRNISTWVYFDNGTLFKSNADFTNTVPIATGFTTGSLVSNFVANTILNLDGEYRVLNTSTMTLDATTLHTVVNPGVESNFIDASTLYFNDGSDFYSVVLDGNSVSSKISTENAVGIINIKSISGDLLIYTVSNQVTVQGVNRTDVSISSLNVNSGVINNLVSPGNSVAIQLQSVNGFRVYFNRLDGFQPDLFNAGMILTDGTGLTEIPNSLWVGNVTNSVLLADKVVSTTYAILNTFDLDQAKVVVGNKVVSYDTSNFTVDSLLATLDANSSVGLLYFTGSTGLGVLISKEGVLNFTDIFYIDINEPGSYIRVTTTLGKNETVLN